MSDYNRSNKDFKKKGDYFGNKEFKKGSHSNRSDRSFHYKKPHYEKDKCQQVSQQPTILLKTRDVDRSSSPSASTAANRKETEAPKTTVLTKSLSFDSSALVLMNASTKFLELNSNLPLVTCLEYLTEKMDFLVIGSLGCQGVGKSYIMSRIADPSLDCISGESDLVKKNPVFASGSIENVCAAIHTTNDIDLYVTKNRIILLDCQPILSPSLTDSDDNLTELASLELAAFLFSVCHVVLLIHDTFFDPDVIRFLQTAEMLKPSASTMLGETMVEYFSHLIFVHNKADDWEFQPSHVKQMQETYLKAFDHSRLQIQTGFGIANGDVSPNLNTNTCGELVNLFLLPLDSKDESGFTGRPSFKDLFRQFRNQILSTPRTPLSLTPLTEKNWFHYASKVWDNIRKSTFFNEYHRLQSSAS